MHISITGDLGSGKSTVAKEICRTLGYKYFSTGQIQRQLALEKGMDTLEFNKYSDNNKEIDQYIDQKLIDLNDLPEPHVLDSRLAWHFVKKSFKVYVMAIDEVAASRVLADDKRVGERRSEDMQAKMREQQERRKSESERFEKTYHIKPSLLRDFDAIIDTSSATIQEVTDLVLSLYEKFRNQQEYSKVWLSPLRIYPTKISEINSETIDCVMLEREFYLYRGKRKLSENIATPYLAVSIVANDANSTVPALDSQQFVKENFDFNYLPEWEAAHNFKFYHYPVLN